MPSASFDGGVMSLLKYCVSSGQGGHKSHEPGDMHDVVLVELFHLKDFRYRQVLRCAFFKKWCALWCPGQLFLLPGQQLKQMGCTGTRAAGHFVHYGDRSSGGEPSCSLEWEGRAAGSASG